MLTVVPVSPFEMMDMLILNHVLIGMMQLRVRTTSACLDGPSGFCSSPQFRAHPLLTAAFVKRLIKLWIEIIPLIMPPEEHCSPTCGTQISTMGIHIMVAPEESAHVNGLIDW